MADMRSRHVQYEVPVSVRPPAEVDVLGEQGQLTIVTAELLPERTADQGTGARHREHLGGLLGQYLRGLLVNRGLPVPGLRVGHHPTPVPRRVRGNTRVDNQPRIR